jgi:hypothetical protein
MKQPLTIFFALAIGTLAFGQSTATVQGNITVQYRPSSSQIDFDRALRAVAVIYPGATDRQTGPAGLGMVVGNDGMIVTAYHLVKDARQLRIMLDGHTYNRSVLLAYDEYKDLAALRIVGEPLQVPLVTIGQAKPEAAVVVVALNDDRKELTPGAMRLLKRVNSITSSEQDENAVAITAGLLGDPGGSPVLDSDGHLVALLTGAETETHLFRAVPAESVLQFSHFSGRVFDPAGTLKVKPADEVTSETVHNVDNGALARRQRTFYVDVDTILIPRDLMINELRNQKEFASLDLLEVDRASLADVTIRVAYVPWTFDYTIVASDVKTTAILAAAKITAFNGYIAAPLLANEFVKRMKEARALQTKAEPAKAEKK